MILKNLSENARSLAANARIEDMSRLIRNHMAGKQDVKNALTGVMVITKIIILYNTISKYLLFFFVLIIIGYGKEFKH